MPRRSQEQQGMEQANRNVDGTIGENVGYIGNVLFETHEDDFLIGFTENYIKVKVPFKKGLLNTIQKVKIEKISSDIEAYGYLYDSISVIK